jgi:hypothetical protein
LFTVEIDRVTESEWSRLLDRFADASLYQTWAYGAVRWGAGQLSHLILRRNGMPVAMAQVRIVQLPVVKAGVAYLRWGPVCTLKNESWDPAVWRAVNEALIDEYVRRRRLTLSVLPWMFNQDPAAAEASALAREMGFVNVGSTNVYQSLRVDLRPSLEAIRTKLAHKWRNQLNAGERNNLEVGEGTSSALYREFAALYREMMARKRFDTSVNIDEFERIQERLPDSQKLMIFIARGTAGVALSGLVASTIGTTGIYLLGATGDAGMKAKSSYVLQWNAIRHLKQLGCEWYDLGGINVAANPGVYHFKQGMGGEEVLHVGRYDRHENALSKLAVNALERLRWMPA